MKRCFISTLVGLLLLWNAFIAGSLFYAHLDEALHEAPMTSVFVNLAKSGKYDVDFHNKFTPKSLAIYCYSPAHIKFGNRIDLQNLLSSDDLEIELQIVDEKGDEIYRDIYVPLQTWRAEGECYAAQYYWWPEFQTGPKKLICKIKSNLPPETLPIGCRIVFQPFVEFIPMIIQFLWIIFSASIFVTLVIAYLYRKTLFPSDITKN
ncbi:MAG: hypothetical protein GY750_12570 [Lentisphaerae bacterium]|nr:hypothetical protein [Lentisphaerota bacterium]MCP4102246.1 hypothetical protein [Lentisphaerota bacterium]